MPNNIDQILENLNESYSNKLEKLIDNFFDKNGEYLPWISDEEVEEFTDCFDKKRSELLSVKFNELVTESLNRREYSWFCSLEVYQERYNSQLLDFLDTYESSNELDFIMKKANQLMRFEYLVYPYYLNESILDRFRYSAKRKQEYLNQKALRLGKVLQFSEVAEKIKLIDNNLERPLNNNSSSQSHPERDQAIQGNPNLKWIGTELELAELIKALCEAKVLKATSDREIFEKFGEFLGVSIDKQQKLQTIKGRTKHGEKAKFIDQLSLLLERWIDN